MRCNYLVALFAVVVFLGLNSFGFPQSKTSTAARKVTPRPVVKARTPIPRKPTSVRRTPTPRRTPVPRRAAAAKPGMVLPKSDYMLKIAPSFKLVSVNETFSQRVAIKSMADGHFDQVNFELRFDPQVLAVQEITNVAVKSQLIKPLELFYDNVTGVLTCKAVLKTKQSDIHELISIKWKALNSGQRTKVRFNDDAMQNEIYFNGEVVSDSSPNAPKWLLDGMVHTRNDDLNPKLNIVNELTLNSVKNDAWEIRMTPEGVIPNKGEVWKVDLEWSNPDLQDLRAINLKIGFDPAKFKILDSDKKNWIRRSVNIWDGFAHAKFPFDCHMLNEVDEHGIINYWMGYQRPYATSSGKFARIYVGVISDDVSDKDIWIDELDIQ